MTLNGIDVSTWQPANITSLVDYDFAIMKASQGKVVARNCDAQYQRAKKRGKLLGVYHFASPGDPVEQADFFVRNVAGYVGEAILVLDLEAAALTQWGATGAKRWLDRVYAKTGVRPLLYVMGSAVNSMRSIADAGYGLWVAHWTTRTTGGFTTPAKPMIGPWPFAAIHQYTDRGHLPGYGDVLDLNIFHGDRAAWLAYAGAKAPAKPSTPPKPKPKPKPKPTKPKRKVKVDGILGSDTVSLWQEVQGTPVTGAITSGGPSTLTTSVQRDLRRAGIRGRDGKLIEVDGLGLAKNTVESAGPTDTIYGVMKALGIKNPDGVFSHPVSPAVKKLQKRLNKGKKVI